MKNYYLNWITNGVCKGYASKWMPLCHNQLQTALARLPLAFFLLFLLYKILYNE